MRISWFTDDRHLFDTYGDYPVEGSRVYFNDASLNSTTIRKRYRVKSVSTTLTKTAISMDLIRREIDSAEHQPKNRDHDEAADSEVDTPANKHDKELPSEDHSEFWRSKSHSVR